MVDYTITRVADVYKHTYYVFNQLFCNNDKQKMYLYFKLKDYSKANINTGSYLLINDYNIY